MRHVHRRGAAGQQYAIIVGLVAVVAIAAISMAGTSIKGLFAKTSNTLAVVTNASSATGGGTSPGPYASCKAALLAGQIASGTYIITGSPDFTAYCDQSTGGGGWTYLVRNGAKTDPALTIGWTNHANTSCGTLSNGNLSWVRTSGNTCSPSYPGTGLAYTFPSATDFTVRATWQHNNIGACAYWGPSVAHTVARSGQAYCESTSDGGWAGMTYSGYYGTYGFHMLTVGTLLWQRSGNTMHLPTGDAITMTRPMSTNDRAVVSVGSGQGAAGSGVALVLQDVFYREQ